MSRAYSSLVLSLTDPHPLLPPLDISWSSTTVFPSTATTPLRHRGHHPACIQEPPYQTTTTEHPCTTAPGLQRRITAPPLHILSRGVKPPPTQQSRSLISPSLSLSNIRAMQTVKFITKCSEIFVTTIKMKEDPTMYEINFQNFAAFCKMENPLDQ